MTPGEREVLIRDVMILQIALIELSKEVIHLKKAVFELETEKWRLK